MTRYAYIFLDESGNFDFGNSGALSRADQRWHIPPVSDVGPS